MLIRHLGDYFGGNRAYGQQLETSHCTGTGTGTGTAKNVDRPLGMSTDPGSVALLIVVFAMPFLKGCISVHKYKKITSALKVIIDNRCTWSIQGYKVAYSDISFPAWLVNVHCYVHYRFDRDGHFAFPMERISNSQVSP